MFSLNQHENIQTRDYIYFPTILVAYFLDKYCHCSVHILLDFVSYKPPAKDIKLNKFAATHIVKEENRTNFCYEKILLNFCGLKTCQSSS
jgi:hypothetical protein